MIRSSLRMQNPGYPGHFIHKLVVSSINNIKYRIMKKYIFYLPFFPMLFFAMLLSFKGNAQQALTNSTVTVAQLKSISQATVAYNSNTGGNFITSGITNRVAVPLGLAANQKTAMNTALYNFLNEKGGFTKLRLSNMAAYQQQLNSLVQQFAVTLAGFLSAGQVNQFIAMKPPSRDSRDPLVAVFY
jgi:hypothetical protein